MSIYSVSSSSPPHPTPDVILLSDHVITYKLVLVNMGIKIKKKSISVCNIYLLVYSDLFLNSVTPHGAALYNRVELQSALLE